MQESQVARLRTGRVGQVSQVGQRGRGPAGARAQIAGWVHREQIRLTNVHFLIFRMNNYLPMSICYCFFYKPCFICLFPFYNYLPFFFFLSTMPLIAEMFYFYRFCDD